MVSMLGETNSFNPIKSLLNSYLKFENNNNDIYVIFHNLYISHFSSHRYFIWKVFNSLGTLGHSCVTNCCFYRWKFIKIITCIILYLLVNCSLLSKSHVSRESNVFHGVLFFPLLSRRKVEIMHTHSLFTLLGERLMLHTNTVTVTTYNTLYEVKIKNVWWKF